MLTMRGVATKEAMTENHKIKMKIAITVMAMIIGDRQDGAYYDDHNDPNEAQHEFNAFDGHDLDNGLGDNPGDGGDDHVK